MSEIFRFKQFSVSNSASALKLGTDAVLLGAAMSIDPQSRFALDIGTGTGVIALMLAQRHPEIAIDAIDIDEASIREASANFAQSPWSDRLRAIHCDLKKFNSELNPSQYLRDNHNSSHTRYDLIFSNPPYYDNSLLNPDEREATARHNTQLSLSDICAFTAESLNPSGTLALIIPADREQSLRRIAASFGLYAKRQLLIFTTSRKPAKRCIIEFCKSRQFESKESLTLMQNGSRSLEYQQLTQDFYL